MPKQATIALTGMANAMHFVRSDGKEIVVGTNREIDEVAYYEFEE